MTGADVEARLIDALTAADARAELRSLQNARQAPESQMRIAEVLAALDAVENERADRLHSAVEALAANGVDAASFTPSPSSATLPDIGLRVPRVDRRRAVEILETAGYVRLAPTTPAAWESYQRTLTGVAFARTGDSPGRLELAWGGRAGRPWHRLLHPDADDWRIGDLPRIAWPIYHLLHVARIPLRLARRSRRAPDLGPFLGTPGALIGPLLDYADVGPDDLVVDLGCGDGRILVEAAARFGCRGRGVESDPAIVEAARARVAAAGVGDRVEIVHGDAAGASVSDAAVVVLFLPVETVSHLVPRLREQLEPTARIVSHELHRQVAPAPDDERILAAGYAITVARRWAPA